MSSDAEVFEQLATLVLSYRPVGLVSIEIFSEWYPRGRSGRGVRFLDKNCSDLGNRMERAPSSTFHRVFGAWLNDFEDPVRNRITLPEGGRPNLFVMTVQPDGRYSTQWSFDPAIDARDEAELRASMGDEDFDKMVEDYREEQLRKATQPTIDPSPVAEVESVVPSETEPMSVAELLAFVVQEVSADAPAGWTELIVDGSVSEAPDDVGVMKTHIHVSYWARVDGQLARFTVSNMFGPPNAVNRLQARAAEEYGQSWQRVHIGIEAGSTSVRLEFDPPGYPDGTIE